MVLKLSFAGLLSLFFTPFFFLLVVRLLGYTPDALDLLIRLMVAECFSFAFSVVLLAVLKFKARSPV